MVLRGLLPLRKADVHGEGHFGASRGSRTHNGVDFACFPGTVIQSHVFGTVTKLGYPYGDDLSYRYVQITDSGGTDYRFFYIQPGVEVGDQILPGDNLGELQDLERRYPGITPHCHFEIKRDGEYIEPELES